jgi:hypothetical protein
MTFAEFQASGRPVDDLRTVQPDAYEFKQPGRVYAGNLVIEDSLGAVGGCWQLVIANDCRLSDDLAALEEVLFGYGRAEGLL